MFYHTPGTGTGPPTGTGTGTGTGLGTRFIANMKNDLATE